MEDKKKAWIIRIFVFHKLNGINGNKKPTEFTIEERYHLKGALNDLADCIRRGALGDE